jgi:hypothetical protein
MPRESSRISLADKGESLLYKEASLTMPIQHGEEKGWAWLDRLPALLAACDRRWGLKMGVRFPNQSPHWPVGVFRQLSRC